MPVANITNTISVIIPTVDRTSLWRSVQSAAMGGLTDDDEIVVVTDGNRSPVDLEPMRSWAAPKIVSIPVDDGPHDDVGSHARNVGLDAATRHWVVYLDDDDAFFPNAMAHMRRILCGVAGRPFHIFRVRHNSGVLIWRTPVLEIGNVSSCGIVHWRWCESRWDHKRYQTDYDFATYLAAEFGEPNFVDYPLTDLKPKL